MFKKKILLAFLLLFLFTANFALALEVNYPNIPFLPRITETSKLPAYISYFFGLAIFLAGILAVISFAIGAIQLIMSAENPENAGNAKDRMKGSVLGLVLTLSAFIILKTINPVLVTPSLTPLGEVPGIYLTNGVDTISTSMEVADTSTIPAGYNKIVYKCAAGAFSPNLLIWRFPKPNFQGNDANYSGVKTVSVGCQPDFHIISGVGSFKIAYKAPGIYYCLGECLGTDWCNGYMSGSNLSSGELSAPFKNNVKSVVIINDADRKYGAIFHNATDPAMGGYCSSLILPKQDQECIGQGITVSSSADIFVWNQQTPYTSGSGIGFYSEEWGWRTGAKGGYYYLCTPGQKYYCDEIMSPNTYWQYWNKKTQDIVFTRYTQGLIQGYQEKYPNFKAKPGSIQIEKNFLVGLYANDEYGRYCQTFTKDIPNMANTDFIASEQRAIDEVYVIPTK